MTIDINIRARITARLAKALGQLGADTQAYIVESLSTPGSVVPFIVSRPGEPSYNWDDELNTGITHEVTAAGTLTLTLRSAGVSKFAKPGKIIAAAAENGAFWDGWAFDSRSSRWVKVARAHMVAPRPHMRPAYEDLQRSALGFLAGEARI